MLNGLLLLHLLLASIAMDAIIMDTVAIIMDTVITDTGFLSLRFIYNIYVEGEILNNYKHAPFYFLL